MVTAILHLHKSPRALGQALDHVHMVFARAHDLTDAHPLMRPPISAWTGEGENRRSALALAGSGLLGVAALFARLTRWIL